jgi:hypothetical protein
VTNLGHPCYPRLVPEVTVPVSQLPKDTFSRQHVQVLYVAWMEAGMRCPVEGCEQWEALEAPRGALPQPQAMLPSGIGRLERSAEDPRKMNVDSITANPSPSFREHGFQFKGLEGMVEHWEHFHMRKGRCFAAPCCSKTPTQRLAATCHDLAFPSIFAAADHLSDVQGEGLRTSGTASPRSRAMGQDQGQRPRSNNGR